MSIRVNKVHRESYSPLFPNSVASHIANAAYIGAPLTTKPRTTKHVTLKISGPCSRGKHGRGCNNRTCNCPCHGGSTQ